MCEWISKSELIERLELVDEGIFPGTCWVVKNAADEVMGIHISAKGALSFVLHYLQDEEVFAYSEPENINDLFFVLEGNREEVVIRVERTVLKD